MKTIELRPQTPEQLAELDQLYRTTRDVRLRQRIQIIRLAAEQGLVACKIGEIVRLNEQSVRRWLKRYRAEGISRFTRSTASRRNAGCNRSLC